MSKLDSQSQGLPSATQEWLHLFFYSGTDLEMQLACRELHKLVSEWQRDPANPGKRAAIVAMHISNLIEWGDSFFRKETPEAIQEALQVYLLVADILGPRPPHIENSKHLIAYWDTVEDRLNKIRNCKNIDGAKMGSSLFGTPIDPALLARANSDIGDIIAAQEPVPQDASVKRNPSKRKR